MCIRPSASLRIRERCASMTASMSTGAPGSRSTSLGAVPRLEQVDALVVGEEHLAHMEPRGRREGPPAGRPGVVRKARGVGRVPRDREVPAGVAGRRRQHQHLLEVGERHRLVLRAVGERAVWDLGPEGEAPSAAAVEGFDERERECGLESRRCGRGRHRCSFPSSSERRTYTATLERGGLPERTKGHAWRACRGVTPSRVRIPRPPPLTVEVLRVVRIRMRDRHPDVFVQREGAGPRVR